jgi:hypothetical protein
MNVSTSTAYSIRTEAMLLLLVSVQKMDVPVWLLLKVSRNRIFSSLLILMARTFSVAGERPTLASKLLP